MPSTEAVPRIEVRQINKNKKITFKILLQMELSHIVANTVLPKSHCLLEILSGHVDERQIVSAYTKTWSGVNLWCGALEWSGFLEWFFGVEIWSELN